MTEQQVNLTFPYFTYPNILCYGYHNTDEYNPELHRLHEMIKKIKTENNKKFLLHITIGAAMEEFLTISDKPNFDMYEFQYQQLFPTHVKSFIKQNPSCKVIHLIISPNESFETDKFKVPLFVTKTPEMNWNRDGKSFYSNNYEVHIFCTMMPTHHLGNNRIINNAIIKIKITDHNIAQQLDKYRQTKNDIEFVRIFYDDLNKLLLHISHISGFVTCFSFATFNEKTDLKRICNFAMFIEIYHIFKLYEHFILAEWQYIEGSYIVRKYLPNGMWVKLIKYVDDEDHHVDDDCIQKILLTINNDSIVAM
mgnify:CR=1 FL=1